MTDANDNESEIIAKTAVQSEQATIECEQVGEIIVVKLSGLLGTNEQGRPVQEEFQRLIGDHHCDFILDCANVLGYVADGFLVPIVRLRKQAKAEAESLGRQYRPLVNPHGGLFMAFDDRETALKEMGKHDGHGWVVLCSVCPEIRDVLKMLGWLR